MTAYAMVEISVTDNEGMGPYREKVADTVAAHGGKYLILGGETEGFLLVLRQLEGVITVDVTRLGHYEVTQADDFQRQLILADRDTERYNMKNSNNTKCKAGCT